MYSLVANRVQLHGIRCRRLPLGPGLHQQPFNRPLHRRGKRGPRAGPVEQDVGLLDRGLATEAERQPHTEVIERLEIGSHRPPIIQKQPKPQRLTLELGAGLRGDSRLAQDGRQAAGEWHEIGVREREKARAGGIGMGREPARSFVLLQLLLQGGEGVKQLHEMHSLVIGNEDDDSEEPFLLAHERRSTGGSPTASAVVARRGPKAQRTASSITPMTPATSVVRSR